MNQSHSGTPTDTPPVFTAHDVADVLAAVPTFFGFHPQESFLAVATEGERNRFGLRLRVDLPEPEQADRVADLAIGHLVRQGADGAILLALTADPERGEAMVRAALAALPPHVTPIVVAWADGERYWEPVRGFPSAGRPYEAPSHHLAVVQAVAEGQEILADRAALVEQFAACEGDELEHMITVTDTELDRILALIGPDTTDVELVGTALAELDPVLDRALREQERLSDREVALVSTWCASIPVRDELWTRITTATSAGWLRVLTDVTRRVVPPFEPSVLCLAGFAAYMRGDGARAVIALERSLEADREYRMSHLLMSLIQGGVSPEVYESFPYGERSA